MDASHAGSNDDGRRGSITTFANKFYAEAESIATIASSTIATTASPVDDAAG